MSIKAIYSVDKKAQQETAHRYRGARWNHLRIMAEPGDLLFGAEVSPKDIRVSGSHNRILTAPDLSYRQFYRVEEASETASLTPIQEASLTKYRLKQDYRLPASADLLRFHDDGKGVSKIELLETIVVRMVEIVPFTQIPEFLLWDPPYHNRLWCQAAFLKEAFAIAGILYFMKPKFKLDALYGSSTLGRFVQFMETQRSGFKHLFDADVEENLRERPELQLHLLLDRVGLRPSSVNSMHGKPLESPLYRIEPMNYILLMYIVRERLHIMPEEDDEPPEHWVDDVPVDWEAAMKNWIQE